MMHGRTTAASLGRACLIAGLASAAATGAAAQETGFLVVAGIDGGPAAVMVDGQRVGTLDRDGLALEVEAGTRAVAVMRSGDPPFRTTVEVPAGGMVELEVRLGDPAADQPAVDPAAGPTYTPMTVRPQLRNQGDVMEALTEHYPPVLRDAGIGGTATVWLFIDPDGRVQRLQLNESSGYDAMDQAALRVAGTMEFTPAENRGERVPVWVSIPITFEVR